MTNNSAVTNSMATKLATAITNVAVSSIAGLSSSSELAQEYLNGSSYANNEDLAVF